MKTKDRTFIFCLSVWLVNFGLLQPVLAQSSPGTEANSQTSLSSVNEELQEELETIQVSAESIQSAIEEQDKNLAATIQKEISHQKIQQVSEISKTINAILDFFGGLSFDDFFGGINLGDIFDDIFGVKDIGGSSDKSQTTGNNGSFGDAGELGLPDSEKVAAAIESRKTSTAEELLGAKTGGSGSVVIKDDINTLYKINLAKEVAEASALTESAQAKLKKKIEVATEALRKSAELASDSSEQDVTQNIMRNISTQMWQQQQTNSILAINAQIEQRDDAIANTLMAETLRELNGERIALNRELAAAYSATITQGAQFTLPGRVP